MGLVTGVPSSYATTFRPLEALLSTGAIQASKSTHRLHMFAMTKKAAFGLFVSFPITCSVFAGFVVMGRQLRGWLHFGYWPTIDLHDVLDWWMGQTISVDQMETRFWELIGTPSSGDGTGLRFTILDEFLRLILNTVPLTVWLIVVFPIGWLLTWLFIAGLFSATRPEPDAG